MCEQQNEMLVDQTRHAHREINQKRRHALGAATILLEFRTGKTTDFAAHVAHDFGAVVLGCKQLQQLGDGQRSVLEIHENMYQAGRGANIKLESLGRVCNHLEQGGFDGRALDIGLALEQCRRCAKEERTKLLLWRGHLPQLRHARVLQHANQRIGETLLGSAPIEFLVLIGLVRFRFALCSRRCGFGGSARLLDSDRRLDRLELETGLGAFLLRVNDDGNQKAKHFQRVSHRKLGSRVDVRSTIVGVGIVIAVTARTSLQEQTW